MKYRSLYLAVLFLTAIFLTGCRTPTGVGLAVEVPGLGHLDFGADPVKCLVDETAGAAEALGLTSEPEPDAEAPPTPK